VFEQFGSFEQSSDFFLAQNYGKLFAVLDARKLDPLVFHPFDPIGEAKGIDSELEVGIRRRIVSPLDQMQVIIDPVRVHFGGKFVEVDRQFGQMPGIAGKGAFALARDDNFLFKLGK
jgi:hypothetical protein